MTGQQLREFRTQVGLTQSKLAEICGLARSSVSRMENGRERVRVKVEWHVRNELLRFLLPGFVEKKHPPVDTKTFLTLIKAPVI